MKFVQRQDIEPGSAVRQSRELSIRPRGFDGNRRVFLVIYIQNCQLNTAAAKKKAVKAATDLKKAQKASAVVWQSREIQNCQLNTAADKKKAVKHAMDLKKPAKAATDLKKAKKVSTAMWQSRQIQNCQTNAAAANEKAIRAATDLVFWPEIVRLPIAFFSLVRNADAEPFRFWIRECKELARKCATIFTSFKYIQGALMRKFSY